MKQILSTILIVFSAAAIGMPLKLRAAETKTQKSPAALSANFVMTRTLAALKTDLKSEGRLVLGGPGRLRWETLSPSKSVLVINAGVGWIHYPDLGVTKRFDISTDPVMRVLSEHLLLLTAGQFDRMGDKYEVSSTADGRILKPKTPEVKKFFKEMQVAMDKIGAVSRVMLISADGDTTTIEFQQVVQNPKLTDDLFAEPKSR